MKTIWLGLVDGEPWGAFQTKASAESWQKDMTALSIQDCGEKTYTLEVLALYAAYVARARKPKARV